MRYNTDNPTDMARLMQSMPKLHARAYWRWLEKQKGSEFMDKVREIVKHIV
ncbi:MAG: hypothetical protein ACUZ8I_14910 [Candidatus Scalindua sp.]